MDEQRQSRLAPVLISLLLLAVPVGAYVAGYFWLGTKHAWVERRPSGKVYFIDRYFENAWLAKAYHPAVAVESWFAGVEVTTSHPHR